MSLPYSDTIIELLKPWNSKTEMSLKYDPTPVLTRIAEIIETERKHFAEDNGDPFDDSPSVTNPGCALGHIISLLESQTNFLSMLVNNYLGDTFFSVKKLKRDVFELNVAACRLLLVVLPDLRLKELEIQFARWKLTRQLLRWVRTSPEPLCSYATGLIPLVICRVGALALGDIDPYLGLGEDTIPLVLSRLVHLRALLTEDSSPSELITSSGYIPIHPATNVTKQMLLLRYLADMGAYHEYLRHMHEQDALSLILGYLDVRRLRGARDSRLAFEALRFLAALLCHEGVAIEFIDMHGLQKCLKVPHPSVAATGVSLCLLHLTNVEEARKRICLLPTDTLADLVTYALCLLECPHESGRSNAANFFGYMFVYRAVLEEFDKQNGLPKLYNVLSTLPIAELYKANEHVSDEQRRVLQRTDQPVCYALQMYLVTRLKLRVAELSRRQDGDEPESPSHEVAVLTESRRCLMTKRYDSTPEEIQNQIVQVQSEPWSQWAPVDELVGLGAVPLLLHVVDVFYDKYTDLCCNSTALWALGALSVCSVSPRVPALITQLVNSPTTGVDLILRCCDTKTRDTKIHIAALNLLANCACAPLHEFGTSAAWYSDVDLENVWECVCRSGKFEVLIELINPKEYTRTADVIRSLARRAVAGLARSPTARRYLLRHSIAIADQQLQQQQKVLMKKSIYPKRRREHSTFRKYARQLLLLPSIPDNAGTYFKLDSDSDEDVSEPASPFASDEDNISNEDTSSGNDEDVSESHVATSGEGNDLFKVKDIPTLIPISNTSSNTTSGLEKCDVETPRPAIDNKKIIVLSNVQLVPRQFPPESSKYAPSHSVLGTDAPNVPSPVEDLTSDYQWQRLDAFLRNLKSLRTVPDRNSILNTVGANTQIPHVAPEPSECNILIDYNNVISHVPSSGPSTAGISVDGYNTLTSICRKSSDDTSSFHVNCIATNINMYGQSDDTDNLKLKPEAVYTNINDRVSTSKGIEQTVYSNEHLSSELHPNSEHNPESSANHTFISDPDVASIPNVFEMISSENNAVKISASTDEVDKTICLTTSGNNGYEDNLSKQTDLTHQIISPFYINDSILTSDMIEQSKPRAIIYKAPPDMIEQSKPRTIIYEAPPDMIEQSKPRAIIYVAPPDMIEQSKPRTIIYEAPPDMIEQSKPRTMTYEAPPDMIEQSEASTSVNKENVTIKRKRNKDNWIDHKNKKLKNSGEAYKGCRSKKSFTAKTVGPVCSCTKQCGDKFNSQQRESLFNNFYKLPNQELKWKYLTERIVSKPVKRITLERKINRKQTHQYSFPLHGCDIPVCKTFFLNTLSISDQSVYTALDKLQKDKGLTDGRGTHLNRPHKIRDTIAATIMEHINLFPRIQSSYVKDTSQQYLSENLNITKMYRLYTTWFASLHRSTPLATKRQYETIFNTEYNYAFFKSKKDTFTCLYCSLHATSITNASLKDRHVAHLKRKNDVYNIKRKEKAAVGLTHTTVADFGLGNVLGVPQSNADISYYKRKYPVFSFTVFDVVNESGYCYVWHLAIARRGTAEIGSCLLQFMQHEAQKGIKDVILYSDCGAGQYKNRSIFATYVYALKTYGLKSITHRFYETGHSMSEFDNMHASIERTMKNKVLFTPDQVYSTISNAKEPGEKCSFKEMVQSDFYDIESLITGKNWRNDTQGRTISWSEIVEAKVSHVRPHVLLLKYDHGEEHFEFDTEQNIAMPRRGSSKKSVIPPEERLKQIYSHHFPLSKPLYDDLLELCASEAIPKHYHGFYKSLVSVNLDDADV